MANVVLDNRLALDVLPTERGGVCALILPASLDRRDRAGRSSHEGHLHPSRRASNFGWGDVISTVWSTVKEALPQFTWSLPSRGPLVATVLLFGPCLFNLLVQFVSPRLQEFQMRRMKAQGFQPIAAEDGL